MFFDMLILSVFCVNYNTELVEGSANKNGDFDASQSFKFF